MSQNEEIAKGLAKAITKKTGDTADTKKALEGVKTKISIIKEAGKKWKEIKKKLPTMTRKEKIQHLGGLVAFVTLSWILKKEDADHFAEGQGEEVGEDETLEDTEAEQELEEEQEEGNEEIDPENDKVISKQQSATNMYAIRYYKKNGSVYGNPNGLGKICVKEKAIPSKYILKRSYELFKNGVGTFDAFKKNVTSKLVQKNVKGTKERIRQAAVILSCCAVGRFQIVPTFHFKRMGWPTRGEEGLRAMYNYIRSTNRQIMLFKKIISGQLNRYKDPGLVAVAYYAGEGVANAYKKNPKSDRFRKKQYGGHASIHSYAQKVRGNFAKFKKEIPGLKDLDYVAMCMEANETGRGIIYTKAKQGKGISDMNVA